jgi:hypothetical protein
MGFVYGIKSKLSRKAAKTYFWTCWLRQKSESMNQGGRRPTISGHQAVEPRSEHQIRRIVQALLGGRHLNPTVVQ